MNSTTLNPASRSKTQLSTSTSKDPRFVWLDESRPENNTFAIFRRNVDLRQPLRSAKIELFADTRYRLRVNGEVVGYGPCRFHPQAPQYDEYDLAPHLKPGRNCITVEVHHRGESSFQAAPSSPGFIAWGLISHGETETTLETPGDWQVRLSNAWVRESPVFSFALPSVEMLDVSALPDSWFDGEDQNEAWISPAGIQSTPWGQLEPRTVAPPSGEMLHPPRAVFLGPLRSEEQQVMFHRRFEPRKLVEAKPFICFAIWLHSPVAQNVDLATFWGKHFINGTELKSQRDPSRGNREITPAVLKQGWNLLFGEIEVLAPSWGFTVGWPRQSELTFAARPSLDETGTLLISDLLGRAELADLNRPRDEQGLARLNGFFQPISLTAENAFPARECAWHAAGKNGASTAPVEFPLSLPRSDLGEGAVVLDFEREWIGHPIIEVECTEPCVLDIANDEALRQDGLLRFYESIHLTNNVDRYWVPAGRHRIESFHERGGRYLQINVRSDAPVVLRSVALRSALATLPVKGSFQCSDPLLNWIWKTGVDTLQASMTDGWVDPWREQGCYLGDVYVEWLATRTYSPDLRLIRRCLQLWEQGQREDGQMPAVVPAHYTVALPDYTLTWILLLRDYFRWTGDRETMRNLWPTVEKIWQSPLWQHGSTGLWNADGINVFGDWGATLSSCTGKANLLLNAFRVGALQASAELARALAAPGQAETFEIEAATIATAIRTHLWDAKQNAFAAGLRDDVRAAETPVHGNILALLFHIASPDQEPLVLDHVLRSLRRDLAQAKLAGKHDGHCDFYFLNFALTMLHERGRHSEALEMIQGFWGLQRARGVLTFTETWSLTEGIGSYCHGWTCSPMISFTSRLLGVQPVAGTLVISPCFPPDIQWAHGTYPHEQGEVEIKWQRKAGEIELVVNAPRGLVKIVVPPGVTSKLIEY